MLFSPEAEAEKKLKVLEKDFKIRTTQEMESEVSLMYNLSKGSEERGIELQISYMETIVALRLERS